MRHRITYIKHPDTDFDPDSITVSHDAISIEGLRASKEHRITLELEQAPKEVGASSALLVALLKAPSS